MITGQRIRGDHPTTSSLLKTLKTLPDKKGVLIVDGCIPTIVEYLKEPSQLRHLLKCDMFQESKSLSQPSDTFTA